MTTRRRLLQTSIAASGLLAGSSSGFAGAAEREKTVTANEDLMREHGVLRRALLVYGAVADRLMRDAASVPPAPLLRTARLFRQFGEDYHERRLEEKYIFPAVRKLSGPAARYPDVLEMQHNRGRELTTYVMQLARQERIPAAQARPLATALQQFNLMYENHTAREDTIVFVAWKDSLSGTAYKEMGERFEAIEKQVFGHDGFEDAVKTIGEIEGELGLTDIAQFTMPAPPRI
ncbi:hemerythrin domain-containing protein [Massilia horti]|uniref:Hemerythrin domain-containing protein n=1 Tax=Massilia horti TaxID=2562153 RepID=A0A4Y9SRQ9_9BURK|nr:hemerythrin domain-containing protein [Massilia horti]TFW27343.1 hemerythrin domain-containing protein [Massilia horti]